MLASQEGLYAPWSKLRQNSDILDVAGVPTSTSQ